MKRLLDLINKSLNGNSNDVSTSRLQSYLIVIPILLMIVVFLGIEIWAFAHSIHAGIPYKLSNEIIVVFYGTLSHHLAILFSRNKAQGIKELTEEPKEDIKDDSTNL